MRRHPIQKVSSSGQVGSRLSLERFQSAGIIWNIIEIMAAASGGKKGGADWGVLFFIRHDTVPINPITRSPDPGVGFVSTDCVSSDGVDQAAAQRIRRWQSEQAASRTGRHARDLSVPECDKSHWRSKAVIDERWMSFLPRSKRMKHGPRDLHLLIQRNSIRCSLARYPLFGRVIGAGGGGVTLNVRSCDAFIPVNESFSGRPKSITVCKTTDRRCIKMSKLNIPSA